MNTTTQTRKPLYYVEMTVWSVNGGSLSFHSTPGRGLRRKGAGNEARYLASSMTEHYAEDSRVDYMYLRIQRSDKTVTALRYTADAGWTVVAGPGVATLATK